MQVSKPFHRLMQKLFMQRAIPEDTCTLIPCAGFDLSITLALLSRNSRNTACYSPATVRCSQIHPPLFVYRRICQKSVRTINFSVSFTHTDDFNIFNINIYFEHTLGTRPHVQVWFRDSNLWCASFRMFLKL